MGRECGSERVGGQLFQMSIPQFFLIMMHVNNQTTVINIQNDDQKIGHIFSQEKNNPFFQQQRGVFRLGFCKNPFDCPARRFTAVNYVCTKTLGLK